MKKMMTRAAETALAAGVAGGVLLIGASVAGAQEAPTTAEGDGVLAGNAVNADVDVPVTLCGVAASLLGVATGTCDNPPAPPPQADTTVAQASGDGVGTGNAVGLDVDAPITVCGVGVVGAGVATGVCNGGAPAPQPTLQAATAGSGGGGGGDTTVAKAQGNGVLAGNAIGLDVDVPITVCGVGGALLGVATGTCALPPPPPGGMGGDKVVATASGNGLLSGNALGLNVNLPINICGIGVAVGGIATGDCVMAAPVATTGADHTSATASGNGFLTGNAIAADVDAPITVCGVGVVGLGVATGVCHTGPPPPPPPCPPHCPPPPCKEECPPPPPPLRLEHPARPIVHRSSARVSELPRTGGTTDVALPLGTGLVAAGMAFMAAARRRAARAAR
ncbi:MAG TPA: chaplin family protein [Acidimicrobiales bacterium]|nr:chaplin family protein [Acidimicrobiales bacterium]